MLCFSSDFVVRSSSPSLRETEEWLCGLQNVTRASVNIVLSSKWVTFQFCVNYPFGHMHFFFFFFLLSCKIHQSVTSSWPQSRFNQHQAALIH